MNIYVLSKYESCVHKHKERINTGGREIEDSKCLCCMKQNICLNVLHVDIGELKNITRLTTYRIPSYNDWHKLVMKSFRLAF